ncbi:hypothetical protein SNE40_001424 [Patella caerulea]|uniref:Uncharacterized protein n=1 Tax=Patella caerulea TaxID=87958 RepID=A0AAN8KDZ0_PATCE
MEVLKKLIGVGIFLVFITQTDAYCYAHAHKLGEGPRCSIDNHDVAPGEIVRSLTQCEECNCHFWGYSCCGIGYNAGTMHIADCKMVKLGDCCYEFVQSSNPSVKCTDVICP